MGFGFKYFSLTLQVNRLYTHKPIDDMETKKFLLRDRKSVV